MLASWFTRVLERLGALQHRRPQAPIAIALLLTVLGAMVATRLELRTRFDQLLPDHQPSVVELRRVMKRTDAGGNIFVVLEGDDTAKLRALGDAMVPGLRAIGSPYVVSAEDGVQAPREFLSPRAGLFQTVPELKKLRDDIQARWDWELRQKDKDDFDLGGDDVPPEKVTGETLKKRFSRGKDSVVGDRYPDGYYQSKDGHALVVIAHGLVASGDLEGARTALARVKGVAEGLHAKDEWKDVKVSYAGDLTTMLAEYGAVKDDLVSVGSLGVGLVLAVVLLFFMRLRALFAMGITIACGLAWTFGLTEIAIGHLNVATGFLVSIVAGNGINFGIIYMARYFEERRLGADPARAVRLAHAGTWPATLTAALSAAASYGSLGVTDFRAFKHFAFIGGVGMVVCWIATYLVLPALLVVVERVRPFSTTADVAEKSWFRRIRMNGIRYDRPFAFIVPRAPRFFAIGGVVLALAGAFAGVRYVRSDPMEYNMRRLQNDLGGGAEMYRVATLAAGIIGAKIESMVVLCDRPAQVIELKKVLEERRDAAPEGEKPFEAVHTLYEFVPDDQAKKIPVLLQIRERAVRAHQRGLIADADWKEIERILPPADIAPYGVDDLPEEIARPFTEKSGARGNVVLIEPTAGKNDTDLKYLMRWADGFRETHLSDGSVVYGSGRAVIFADMLKQVVADMPRAILLSLGMTVLAVILTFRRGAHSVVVVGALFVGLLWLVLSVAAMALKINFFNFIAFPITFGIGVDYAVNFVSRYDMNPKEGILGVLKNTGGAVILCSLTTMLGYLALLGSINQAIRSLGMVAVLGEIACLLAAVVVLPAILLWREHARRASLPDEEEAITSARPAE